MNCRVVGILLHVLYCCVEMWALGALCPGGFVRGSATGLAYVTGSTFHALNRNNMPLGIILINVIHLAFSYLYIWLALLIA